MVGEGQRQFPYAGVAGNPHGAAGFERTTHNNMTRTAVDSLSMPPYAYIYLLGSIIAQNTVLEGFW
jgi:hypothetical protein